jgi:L-amino acid N-acyltransferase YncA
MIESNDPSWENLVMQARIAKDTPAEWRRQHQLYGDLGREIQFGKRFDYWLHLIWSQGTEKAIQTYLES